VFDGWLVLAQEMKKCAGVFDRVDLQLVGVIFGIIRVNLPALIRPMQSFGSREGWGSQRGHFSRFVVLSGVDTQENFSYLHKGPRFDPQARSTYIPLPVRGILQDFIYLKLRRFKYVVGLVPRPLITSSTCITSGHRAYTWRC
jgi:hypothetical protein